MSGSARSVTRECDDLAAKFAFRVLLFAVVRFQWIWRWRELRMWQLWERQRYTLLCYQMAAVVTRVILGSQVFTHPDENTRKFRKSHLWSVQVYKPSFISGGHENWSSPQYQVECATQLFRYAAFNCRNAPVHVFHIDTMHEHFATGGHPVIITIDTAPTLTFDLRAVIVPDSRTLVVLWQISRTFQSSNVSWSWKYLQYHCQHHVTLKSCMLRSVTFIVSDLP